jgi:hypothetical protein
VLALCAIAVLKPLYEVATGAPAFPMALGAHVVQVPVAHAAGVLVGITCALARHLACSTSTKLEDNRCVRC